MDTDLVAVGPRQSGPRHSLEPREYPTQQCINDNHDNVSLLRILLCAPEGYPAPLSSRATGAWSVGPWTGQDRGMGHGSSRHSGAIDSSWVQGWGWGWGCHWRRSPWFSRLLPCVVTPAKPFPRCGYQREPFLASIQNQYLTSLWVARVKDEYERDRQSGANAGYDVPHVASADLVLLSFHLLPFVDDAPQAGVKRATLVYVRVSAPRDKRSVGSEVMP